MSVRRRPVHDDLPKASSKDICKFEKLGWMDLKIDLDASPNPILEDQLELELDQLELDLNTTISECWDSNGESIGPDSKGLDSRITKNQAVKDCMIQWKTRWFTTFIESKQYEMLSSVDKLCGAWPNRMLSYVHRQNRKGFAGSTAHA